MFDYIFLHNILITLILPLNFLNQDFQLGIFHLDNEVTYQKSSNQDVLPLPDLVLYHNFYLKFGLAKKVLQVELGTDVRYFTQYYPYFYSHV